MRRKWLNPRSTLGEELKREIRATHQHIDDAARELKEATSSANTVGWSPLALSIATIACILTGIASWLAFSASLSATPPQVEFGRIGVATLGDTPAESPINLISNFASTESGTTSFTMFISGEPHEPKAPTRIVLYFCGTLRHGLTAQEANLGPLEILALPKTGIETDSALGYRSECNFATTNFSNGFQAIIFGEFPLALENIEGSNALFSAPGTSSTIVPEQILHETSQPLPRGSTVSTTIDALPADLLISSALPHLPTSSNASWTYESRDPLLPTAYSVRGKIESEENRSRIKIFAAGTLSGVSGAALLWSVEEVSKARTIRRSQKKPSI